MTEDEMVVWYHQLNGYEFEQTPGDGEGQGSLECFSPWGCMHGHDLVTKQPQTHPNIESREKISVWNKHSSVIESGFSKYCFDDDYRKVHCMVLESSSSISDH